MDATDEFPDKEAGKSAIALPAKEGKVMPKNSETAGLDFLDFLFTVAMSVGLTPELLQVSGLKGLMSAEWQLNGRCPTRDEWFIIFTFGLGFLNLTLSWFGYHASIKSRPLNYSSGNGMIRFILDVSLVIMYGIILVKYNSFRVVLSFLIFVYIIYVIWDCLKIREYWKPKRASDERKKYFYAQYEDAKNNLPAGCSIGEIKFLVVRREWVSLLGCVLFIVSGLFYFLCGVNRWFVLTSAILITVLYRVNKIYPLWERLFVNKTCLVSFSEFQKS